MRGIQTFFLVVTCLPLSQGLSAQVFDWATKTVDGSPAPYAIAVDASGNSYLTGAFEGVADFDPGPGGTILTSAGYEDVYIAKFNAAGTLAWAHRIGDIYIDMGHAVTVDAGGDVLVTGRFQDTIDADPGPGVYSLVSPGSGTSAFLLKFSSAGNLLWGVTFAAEYVCIGRSILTDAGRNIYVTGAYSDTTDFNGVQYVGNILNDAYVAKLSPAGTVLWVRGAGSFFGNETGRAVAVDAASNVYYAGKYKNTVDFDPGSGTYNQSSTVGYDAYCSKLDSNGNFLWVKTFEGNGGDDEIVSIGVDSVGDLYVDGNFFGTLDADPGPATLQLNAMGGQDVFALKLDTAGNLIWAQCFGGTGMDECQGATLDPAGDSYSIGSFQGMVDFDPDPGLTHTRTAVGGKDVFLHKLDTAGNFQGVWPLGSTMQEYGVAVSFLAPNLLYSTGLFAQTLDLDPGPGVHNLTTSGGNAVYVQRLIKCSANASTINEAGCDYFISPSGNYTWNSSGTYMDTLTNSAGCDSVITVNLTIHSSTASSFSGSACDSYVSPSGNHVWTSSGTYQDTVTNSHGCDSIVTATITILESTTSTLSPTVCDSFTVPSGQATYTTSGTYMDVIPNAIGCDSVITIQLTVVAVNVGVTQNGGVLTAQATNATYQWVDCDSGYLPVAGATGQVFTPTVTGNYAVIVTENGCSDTSACFDVTVVGIGQLFSADFSLFPNPAGADIVLKVNDPLQFSAYALYDPTGRLVAEERIRASETVIDLSQCAAGMYCLQLRGESWQHLKFLKH